VQHVGACSAVAFGGPQERKERGKKGREEQGQMKERVTKGQSDWGGESVWLR